jgi:hypothetical protein
MSVIRKQELLRLVPEGLPVTRQWLIQQDKELDRHAVDNLVKSGQLVSLAHGTYIRPGTTLTWEGVVCYLQNVLKLALAPGGLTALELKGLSHYVALSDKKTIHLYGKDPLPKWINGILPNIEFIKHRSLNDLGGLGFVNDEYDTGLKKLYSGDPLSGFQQTLTEHKNLWPFTRSSPERAYLEILVDVPDAISFEYADQLMQGLTALSPRRLESLLKRTKNIKVRRLFYWFAERHQYAWFKKLPPPLALDELGLGSGKRMLVQGGKLDTKYMITVPEDMWTQAPNTTNKSSF